MPALDVGTAAPAFEALQGQLLDAPEEVPDPVAAEAPAESAAETVVEAAAEVVAELPAAAPAEAPAMTSSLFGADGTPALPESDFPDSSDPSHPPPQPQH